MSRAILIYGQSGVGKTTSLKTLDPKKTLIIDADRKGLSWRGWRNQYSKEKKNYAKTSEVADIENLLDKVNVNKDLAYIENVVIDGLSTIMVDDEVKRMKDKGFDKWTDLAQCIWGLVTKASLLRDDLNIIFIGHVQTDSDENSNTFSKVKSSGRKLDKFVLESKFTTVLFAKHIKGETDEYIFETQSNNSTAKSPLGCFKSSTIPNDMQFVIDSLKKYETEE